MITQCFFYVRVVVMPFVFISTEAYDCPNKTLKATYCLQ